MFKVLVLSTFLAIAPAAFSAEPSAQYADCILQVTADRLDWLNRVLAAR